MKHLGGHNNNTHLDEGALLYLKNTFKVQRMLDVGCGPGGMLELAHKHNISYLGIDGDKQLKLKPPNFLIHDFSHKLETKISNVDLVWSVEFLEHVEERYIPNYIEVFKCAKVVFCTAAPPGKKGYHHVNCKPLNYWIDVFEKYGFAFEEEHSRKVRKASTMRREFVRQTGMVFSK